MFVPPVSVLRENKLSAYEKQAVFNSFQKLMEYWESELPKSEYAPVVEARRTSKRFNSPSGRVPEEKVHKGSGDS